MIVIDHSLYSTMLRSWKNDILSCANVGQAKIDQISHFQVNRFNSKWENFQVFFVLVKLLEHFYCQPDLYVYSKETLFYIICVSSVELLLSGAAFFQLIEFYHFPVHSRRTLRSAEKMFCSQHTFLQSSHGAIVDIVKRINSKSNHIKRPAPTFVYIFACCERFENSSFYFEYVLLLLF